MRELKLVFGLIVSLVFSPVFMGCAGKVTTASNAMSPATTTPTPDPTSTASPSPSPTPADPTPSPSPSPSPSPTPNSTTLSDIQKQGGWQGCSGGCTSTSTAAFSMAQGVASPSLSGDSSIFQLLSGSQPYSGALWFNYVGNLDSPTHFVYDLYFYVDNPSVSQGLEFTVSQSSTGSRYNFSTQCELAGQNVWRVWNPAVHGWAASSVTCTPPAPNTWNHLTWEFERDSDGNVIFDAVTLNGNRELVNLTMTSLADTQTGVSVSFQSDADSSATPYSVWLDKINLTYW